MDNDGPAIVAAAAVAKAVSKKSRAKRKDKKADRLDKKAARKEKRADRKNRRADKAEAKGKTGKARVRCKRHANIRSAAHYPDSRDETLMLKRRIYYAQKSNNSGIHF